jgi:transcription elongation factor GreB
MSKAFVKDDSLVEQELNFEPLELDEHYYFTPSGMRRLEGDLRTLRSEAKKEVQVASSAKKRLHYLEEILRRSEVLDPEKMTGDRIRFGATVTVEDGSGRNRIYRIVGIYEADSKTGKVSYISPIAKALLGRRQGDSVVFRAPQGEEELEILEVRFIPID